MYELINIIKKSNRVNSYILKDKYGQVLEMGSGEVKELIHNGQNIIGLKIAIDGRLIKDKRFNRQNINIQHNKDSVIYSGENLSYITKISERYKDRDVVSDILKYIMDTNTHKIFILHGIRRVGKTIAIKVTIEHLIKNNINKNDIIYIEVTSEISINSLINRIRHLKNKIIFIDEVTRATGFIEQANYLSDIMVGINNNRIILAGTESLAFPISDKTSLYDRAEFNRCTLIPFKEYINLFSNKIIDNEQAIKDYMIYGGALLRSEFSNYNNVENTLNAVVISNIRLTIHRNKSLIKMDKDLSQLLRLTDDIISYLIYDIIYNSISPRKYGGFVNNLIKMGKDKISILAEASGIQAEMFIGNERLIKGINSRDIVVIINVLNQLDIIGKLNNLVIDSVDDDIYRITDIEICTLIQALYFRLKYRPDKKDKILGDLMENMILSQIVMYQRKNKDIEGLSVGYSKYRYINNEYEIDCIVKVDKGLFDTRVYAIEIKYGNKAISSWKKNLIHEKLHTALGVDKSSILKYIVYNGKTIFYDDIYYINAYDFMYNINDWLNK